MEALPPRGYFEKRVIDLTGEQKIRFSAILLGLVLIIFFTVAMYRFVNIVRPGALDIDLTELREGGIGINIDFLSLLGYIIVLVLVLIFHELIHGVFYWIVSGEKPKMDRKGVFIYVSAQSRVYFQRNKYLLIGVAPVVLLTLVGIILVSFLPHSLILYDLVFVILNAAGSAGDLVMIFMLLSYPSSSLIQDLGSEVVIYELSEY